jgi:RNA polymerase sigma-70 factor (ECF subfamily)
VPETRAIVSGSGVIPPEVTYARWHRRALMWLCRSPECDCEGHQRRSLARDESAANELARTLTPMVNAVVRKKLPYAQPDERAEVRQDTFLLVFRNLGQWRGECRFCFWVRQIAIRAAFDQSRRDQRQKRIRKSEDDPDRVIVPQTPPLSPQVWKDIDQTLERLPDDQRRAFEMRVRQDKTIEEIATAIGRSDRTIFTWMERISKRLLECLD